MALHSTANPRPELPAFCRTRQRQSTHRSSNRMQRVERLLYLLLAMQGISLLLLCSGHPAQPMAAPGEPNPAEWLVTMGP